jgi:hypothetical protein
MSFITSCPLRNGVISVFWCMVFCDSPLSIQAQARNNKSYRDLSSLISQEPVYDDRRQRSMVTISVSIGGTKRSSRVCSATFFEVWVLACCLGGYASRRVVNQHHLKELQSILIEVRAQSLVHVSLPLGEGWFEVGEAGLVRNSRPFGFGRCT